MRDIDILGFFSRGLASLYHLFTWILIVGCLCFALIVFGLRYFFLPQIDDYRENLAVFVGQAVGQPLTVGKIEGHWQGYRPELRLYDVEIFRKHDDTDPEFAFVRVDVVVTWLALLAGELRFYSIELFQPVFNLSRDSNGVISIAGVRVTVANEKEGNGLEAWLRKQRQIIVREASVTLSDEMRQLKPLLIKDASLRVDNVGGNHRIGLEGKPPENIAESISIRSNLNATPNNNDRSINGRLYLEFVGLNLLTPINWFRPTESTFTSGSGDLSFWIDVDASKINSVTTKFNLKNIDLHVQGAKKSLKFAKASGSLFLRDFEKKVVIKGRNINVSKVNKSSPLDLNFDFRSSRDRKIKKTSYELDVSNLDISSLLEHADSIPLPGVLQDEFLIAQPKGILNFGSFKWSSEARNLRDIEANITFNNFGLNSIYGWPEFSGAAGEVEVSQNSGKLMLESRNMALGIPKLSVEPIMLKQISSKVSWKFLDDEVRADFENVEFSSDFIVAKGSGVYRKVKDSPAIIRLNMSAGQCDVKEIWRYVPNKAKKTRGWLERALLAGRLTDLRTEYIGPMHKFPFVSAKDGKFFFSANFSDVDMAYAKKWPIAKDMEGLVIVKNNRMDVEITSGKISETEISEGKARIENVGMKKERLWISGKSNGQVENFLDFVLDSPISRNEKETLSKIQGDGAGNLSMELTMPLFKKEKPEVIGYFQGSGTLFKMADLIPPVSNYNVKFEFNENTIRSGSGNALFLGKPLIYSASLLKDGGLGIDLKGGFKSEALVESFESRIFRYFVGDANWNGRISFRKEKTSFVAFSNLVGTESLFPKPFGKGVTTNLPSKIRVTRLRDGDVTFAVEVGDLMQSIVKKKSGKLEFGRVIIGSPLVKDSDVSVLSINLDKLDADIWKPIFHDVIVDVEDDDFLMRSSEMRVYGKLGSLKITERRFDNVDIVGDKTEGIWSINVVANELVGNIFWNSVKRGRIKAEFERISLPTRSQLEFSESKETGLPSFERKQLQKQYLISGVDLIVEDLTYNEKAFGRIELAVDPYEQGWNLRRLVAHGNEGKFSMRGTSKNEREKNSAVDLTFETEDVGKTFVRFGYPEGVIGGTGKISGPLSWAGDLYQPNIESLAGALRIEVADGRFAKLEPGVAKLLGILSLQALPRRLTLDFRDIFSSGFSFKEIVSDVVIEDGIVSAKTFRMEGTAARVQMGGSINLVEETQDLRVRVLPQLTTATAVAGAAVVNPVIGLATLVIQKILGDPVEEIAARTYHVTGTWTNPLVRRILRQDGEEVQ